MKIHGSIIPTSAAKIMKYILQYLNTRELVVEWSYIYNNLLFTFWKVARTIPSYKGMSRTYHNTHTWDSVARRTMCLSPYNGIMLGVACVDLHENLRLEFQTRKRDSARLRLIDVVHDEILICYLLHKRAPSWHQLNVFQTSILALQLKVCIDRNIQNVKKPDWKT